MLVLGINTALRISDLLCLKWKDVWNFEKKDYHLHLYVTEHKTGTHTCIALYKSHRHALKLLRKREKKINICFFSQKF